MFANPLGLLALLALPAIVALHLFRRRYRRRVTAALFLWGGGERTPASGRRRERLIRSPTLAAELLAALALALALAAPRCSGPAAVPHLVAVIDGSASMAVELPEGSPAEQAVAALGERLDTLPRRARVTIIESGPRPAVRVGPGAQLDRAREFLASWQPAAARHEIGEAITAGLRLAGADGEARTVAVEFYTDRFEPERYPTLVGVHAFGQPADNVALVGARRERRAGIDSLTLVAANFGAGRATRTLRVLEVSAGEPLLVERQVTLDPGRRSHLALELPADSAAVRVELDGDALPIDDVAFLAPPWPRTVRVASGLDAELERQLGLTGAPNAPLGRLLGLADETRRVAAGERPDLFIGSPEASVGARVQLLLHRPEAGVETRSWIGPFLVERATRPLGGITLDGVVWTASTAPRLPGATVISTGEQPLASLQERSDGFDLHLDYDPSRSTLHRAPDWPILLAGAVELARDQLPGPAQVNLRAGESLRWLTDGAAELALVGPLDGDGSPTPVASLATDRPRPLLFGPLERPGLYSVTRDGQSVALVGQSLVDEAISDLRDRSSGERPSAAQLAEVEVASDAVAAWLAALGLAALVADAFFLRGRPTGSAA